MPSRTVSHALLFVVASMIALPLAAQSSGSCFDCNFNDDPEPPVTTETGECNTGGWGGCPAQCSSCWFASATRGR